MTDRSDTNLDALPLPIAPIEPRPELTADLRARLHRRLGLPAPAGAVPLPKAVGVEYEVAGPPDGEVVLFMHAGTATAFVPLMHEPALVDRYRLVRYHRRGFAGSDPAPQTVGIVDHARDAVALLDRLGIDRAHVVGHSGSGVMALQVAIDTPDRVRSLVLEEPAIHGMVDPRWNAIMLDAIRPLVAMHRAGESSRAMERWMRGISRSWRADLTRTVPGGAQQTIEDAAAFFADVDAVVAWSCDHDRISALQLPVLYVLADGSNPAAYAVMHRLRALVPHMESIVIAGATHMLHTDEPEAVAAALRDFFDRHTT